MYFLSPSIISLCRQLRLTQFARWESSRDFIGNSDSAGDGGRGHGGLSLSTSPRRRRRHGYA